MGFTPQNTAGGVTAAVASFFQAPEPQASSLVNFGSVPIAVGNGLMSRVSDDYCIKVILP